MPRLRARHDLGKERADIPRPCDRGGPLRRQVHGPWHRTGRKRSGCNRSLKSRAAGHTPKPCMTGRQYPGYGRIMGAVDNLPTAADIEAASKRLAGVAVRTPLVNSPVLDDAVGARVFLKAESLQRTGSFKFRGAYNKISSIPADRRAAGVVAYSSGNHAQGVAAAARLLGMRATIVMPADAPKAKRERTLALGAEVVPYDRNSEDRAAIAKKIVEDRGATLVPPYDDPLIIAGQGTIGAEI